MAKRKSKKSSSSKKKTVAKKAVSKVKTVQKSPINHFEIPFDDIDRMKKFYASIFGWTYVDMPEMDYTMVYTTEVDKDQRPTSLGAVNGGFTKRNPIQISPTLVITVSSVDDISEQIKSSGGELLGEKIPVGNMGIYQLFKDPDGNVLGLYENLQPM